MRRGRLTHLARVRAPSRPREVGESLTSLQRGWVSLRLTGGPLVELDNESVFSKTWLSHTAASALLPRVLVLSPQPSCRGEAEPLSAGHLAARPPAPMALLPAPASPTPRESEAACLVVEGT